MLIATKGGVKFESSGTLIAENIFLSNVSHITWVNINLDPPDVLIIVEEEKISNKIYSERKTHQIKK